MRLQTRCKNCKEFFKLSVHAVDRFQLAKKIGADPKLRCSHCNAQISYDLNDILAEPSKFVGLIALAIFIFGTAFTFLFFWDYLFRVGHYAALTIAALISIPSYVYAAINKSQEQKVIYFNRKSYG